MHRFITLSLVAEPDIHQLTSSHCGRKISARSMCAVVLVFLIASLSPREIISHTKEIVGKSQSRKSTGSTATSKRKKSSAQNRAAAPTSSNSIRSSTREFEQLKASISSTKTELKTLEKKETTTAHTLKHYQRQSHQITRYVELLQGEIGSLQDSIGTVEKTSMFLQTRLSKLQSDYARIVKKYQQEKSNERSGLPPEYIPNESGDKSIRRKEYLRRITQQAGAFATEITHLKDSLQRQKKALAGFVRQRESVLKKKDVQQQELSNAMTAQEKYLAKVRMDKSKLLQALQSKISSARKLAGIISSLVRKEASQNRKQTQLLRRKNSGNQAVARKRLSERTGDKTASRAEPADEEVSSSEKPKVAAFKPGGLHAPLRSMKLLRGYGNYKVPETNTIMENPGIDLSAGVGSSVVAVAPGEVSVVSWLPGYGYVVIVNHNNGFRSVYANLSSWSVTVGSSLSTGQQIGKTGESVDGAFLHFELWRNGERLNPTGWVK